MSTDSRRASAEEAEIDLDDPLLGEKGFQDPQTRRRERIWTLLYYANNIFTVILTVILVYMTVSRWLMKSPSHDPAHIQELVFTDNEDFKYSDPESSDSAWRTIRPSGSRFIKITGSNADAYMRLAYPYGNNNASAKSPIPGTYALSVTQQIHCLAEIKSILMRGDAMVMGGEDVSFDLQQAFQTDAGHAMHCVEFIRQAIMCNGDVALEEAYYSSSDHRYEKKKGSTATHQCRDFSAVMSFVRENQHKDHSAFL